VNRPSTILKEDKNMDPLPKKPKAEMFHPPLPSPQPKLLPSMPLSNINTSNTISTPTRPTPKRTKVNKKKTCRRWTAEEDERLRKAVEKYGPRVSCFIQYQSVTATCSHRNGE